MSNQSSLEALKQAVLQKQLKQSIARQAAELAGERPSPTGRDQPLPLSWAQQRLWFLDQLNHEANVAYHMPIALRLSGRLDQDALRATLDRLVARHEVLRTTFAGSQGQTVQQIAPAGSGFALRTQDLSGLHGHEQEAALERTAVDEASAPFDLAQGPLIRGCLVRLAPEQHVLLVTQHHIISDGWSIGVLVREVSALYAAFCQGLPDPLPPLPLQYADYAAWQQQWLSGPRLQGQLDFWRRHLDGAPALTALPLDYPRAALRDHAGAQCRMHLPPALAAGLRELSARHGTTLFMTALAAWTVLLARTGGQDDIVVGTAVANRRHSTLEPLLGLFVNTLALRVRLDDDPDVAQLLARVRQVVLDGQVHQDVPFEQVVAALRPERSLSHTPLFQAMFSLDNTPDGGELALPGLALDVMAQPVTTSQFDLSLSLSASQDGIDASLTYASALFERGTVERMLAQFALLLEAMVADASQRVSALTMLDADGRDQVVNGFNDTAEAYDTQRLVHQCIEAQVAATPDAVALRCEGASVSYDALNRRANQVAHHLRALGAQPGQRVAVCMERSVELVVALLGVMKSGAAYVPLDPELPAQRLEFMLADAAPCAVLAGAGVTLPATPAQVPVLVLDPADAASAFAAAPQDNPAPVLDGASVAYVIYTSGSTGQPKGVLGTHGGLLNRLHWMQQRFALGSGDHVLQKTPFGFDVSVWEFFWPLMVGARLVLARPQGHRDSAYLAQLINAEQVSTLHFVPSMLADFLREDTAAGCLPLRRVFCSGEALPGTLVERFFALLPGCELHNLYGPTEAAIDVTWFACRPEHGAAPVPIGRPIANTQVLILDPLGQPVPVGVAGEIHLGGVQLAQGYLNRPQLTAERFIAHPLQAGARLYKTGDLGRWRADGQVEYLGRNDFQVKLRGVRIELGEIEAQLGACPGVREAVVLARGEGAQQRLVAYVTAQEGAELSAAGLRAALARSLAEYMVPSAFVVLAALPLSVNGKLDRQALPAPDDSALARRAYAPPQGALEKLLAALWGELLQVAQVGRDDNFFELGGHSLIVVTLIERLREHGLDAAVRDVFAHPALAAMAAVLVPHGGAADGAAGLPNLIPDGCTAIVPAMLNLVALGQEQIDRIAAAVPQGAANIEDIYPLSPLQEGILFHHLLAEEGDLYLLRTVLEFEHRERLSVFLAALQTVIDRHPILRTSMHWVGLPAPVQVVQRRAVLPLCEIEVDGNADALDALLRATDPRTMRLDLGQAPLVAAHVAAGADGRCHLALLNHHLVTDHVTLELLIAEVGMVLAGRGGELPKPVPYRDFVQRGLAVPAEQHQAYFRQQLGDIDAPTAPFGLLDLSGGAAMETAHGALERALAQRIRQCGRRLGVGPAVLFHVAWAQVLGQCSGRDDVVFGTVLSGRLQGGAQAARAVGMFMNTLPLRVSLRELGVAEAVRRMHLQLGELLVHEQASLVQAQACSGVAAPAPLFSALFNFRHNGAVHGHGGAALEGISLLRGEERTNYPVSMAVDDLGVDFALTAQCRGVAPARLVACLRQAVEQLVTLLESAPDTELARVPVLPADERRQVLEQWNQSERAYPAGDTLPAMFARQVARAPERVALACDEVEWTYAMLDDRANRLAHYLRGQGVGPDVLVGVCLERSPDMLAALLAVHKAGGAYVPLDPAYPQERLAYMVGHAQPRLVLTQQSLRGVAPGNAVCVDTLALDAAPAHATDGGAPADLAYVIYTSGSTGQPKGVAVSQGALCNFLHAMLEQPGLEQDDVLVAVTSLSFDIAALELFLPLVCGARTVIAARAVAADPARLAQLLESSQASVMQATPSTWRMLCALRWPTLARPLKVLCGGEALPADLARQLLTHVPDVWNMYGPTETTIWSALRRLTVDQPEVTLGHPIANTRLYVLDERQQPAPLGVPGELYIGGAGLARGYLHSEERTAERFLPDPFAGGAQRMYRTGDLVRRLADGQLDYLGRLDQQVKLNGFRIELGEIETALRTHAGVAQAVVAPQRGPSGETRLVAYVVPQAGSGAAAPSFSLFYFGADAYDPADKYRLYLEAAGFADRNGFEAVWTPERHFHATGSLYPNPALLNAALSTVTQRVQLRAGSVVLPLHHPVRVAEDWSVIDNLSHGRCGVAIASGWHPRDFVLAPHNFAQRKQAMLDGIATLRALWSGQAVTLPDGAGNDAAVTLFPRPVQPELPLWVTAAGNPETFVQAGTLGANLLTHLLGQTVEEVGANIALYRAARRAAGHAGDGRVTLMVHTFIGDDQEATLERARAPFQAYMQSHLGLLASMIASLNLPAGDGSEQERERLAAFAYERYSRSAALIGTPDSCLPLLRRLAGSGVDEVACLIDWMPPADAMAALPALQALRQLALETPPEIDARALRGHLQASLPDYMLPAAFVALPALPLTPNGKLDRQNLPQAGFEAAGNAYEAPRGPVEVAIGQLWQELLGVVQVGRHDNFFELGGHSLLALRLVARLRAQLDREIELRMLVQHPTLAQFCAAIDVEAMASALSCLSQIRAGGAQAPLFLLHTGAGDSFYANDLAPSLAPDLPLYSLTARGYFSDEAPMTTLPEMAGHYLQLVREVQPEGPYRLAGWSTGGLLAYEMARQLRAAGQPVEFVGLIDTGADLRPYPFDARLSYGRAQQPGEYDVIATLLHEMPAGVSDGVAARCEQLAVAGDVDALLLLGQELGVIPAEYALPTLRRLLAVRNAMDNAVFRYTPQPIDVPVTMFKGVTGFSGDKTLGWGRLLPDSLTLVEVPGDHLSMVDAVHRPALGAALGLALAQAGAPAMAQGEAA